MREFENLKMWGYEVRVCRICCGFNEALEDVVEQKTNNNDAGSNHSNECEDKRQL